MAQFDVGRCGLMPQEMRQQLVLRLMDLQALDDDEAAEMKAARWPLQSVFDCSYPTGMR